MVENTEVRDLMTLPKDEFYDTSNSLPICLLDIAVPEDKATQLFLDKYYEIIKTCPPNC